MARANAADRDIDDGEACAIRLSLQQLLASINFSKAQRMSRLITFLIEAELMGETASLCEYAVGMEVFDRDARSYSTCEDPIVRVQMGRLRERLAHYYAQAGAASAYRFSVPLGSYRPIIARVTPGGKALDEAMLLSVVPLVNCNPGRDASAFTQGLNEELAFRLFHAFSHRIVPNHFAQSQALTGKARKITHVLEGSVRAAAAGARVSLRVIDVAAGCMSWCEQFDRDGPCDLAGQEALAGMACSALQLCFFETSL
ncbi:hypothetical protein H7U20_25390 [Rugamonas sp. CCM 8940]|nr:hypothetical protein [Rugamonas sp. CCM 8940]